MNRFFAILFALTKNPPLHQLGHPITKQQLRRIKLAISSLSIWILPATLTASPTLSAERIYASYGLLEQSLSINSLETYANEGKIDQDLAAFAKYANPQELAQLRKLLLTRIPLSPLEVSQFLYTPLGERLLARLGQVIQTPAHQSGFYAIRAALILAAADPQGLTLLNVLHKFPLPGIRINLARGLEIVDAFERLVNQTNQAIAAVNQQATLEARATRLSNFSQLPDLRLQGSFTWEKRTITLNDRSRDRIFPVDIYLPVARQLHSQNTPRPVIVISHGLGSDRKSFEYLAQHLASYGFVIAVPEHPGSDAKQLQALVSGRADEVTSPREFIDRPLDVKYLLDELTRLSQSEPEFQGRLNLQQVGVIGQSFGGYTVLALAGAKLNFQQLQTNCSASEDSLNLALIFQCLASRLLQRQYDLSDPRVKAAIAIDPVDSSIIGQAGLSQIKIPIMMVAGSADTVAPALPEQIRPFTWLTTLNKYLVVIKGGTHFSTIEESHKDVVPIPFNAIGPNPALARLYVKALSVAFFQTYIANQPSYRPYLSAAYANAISREPLQLNLVRSLSTTELEQALKGSTVSLTAPNQ